MQRTIVTHTCDLGDGEANAHRGTILSLDGRTVEIDLSDRNYERLELFLSEYFAHGRRVASPEPRGSNRHTDSGRPTPVDEAPTAADVRAWFIAQGRGHEISPRGRIANRYYQEYIAATAAA